jgi:hypothetical protein
VLDRKRCARSQARMHLIVCCAFDRTTFDHEECDRSQITALKSHGTSELAMAARATRTSRVDEACAQSH